MGLEEAIRSGQVVVATCSVAVVGIVVFFILTWLQIDAPLFSKWLSTPDGEAWFDAARTAVTILGIGGIGGAAYLAYRKQRNTEETYQLNIRAYENAVSAQETSARVLAHDIEKYARDRQDATTRDLRGRYTTSAEQLGHESPAIRLAGVYALASLANDWHHVPNDDERQVCINVLRAYLRMEPTPTVQEADETGQTSVIDPRELEVRQTIVRLIQQHALLPDSDNKSWLGCITTFRRAKLHGIALEFEDLTGANLGRADLTGANLGRADLADTILTGANLSHANLSHADVADADVAGADLAGAFLTGTDLVNADLAGANLARANLAGANLARANLTRVNLTGARYDATTRWPDGFTPPSEAIKVERLGS